VASRLTWIVLLLALAIYGILTKPLVLGLDLQGGATMRYELSPPDSTPENVDIDDMIDATVDTLRDRINTYGIRESAITRQGVNEILIELPGSSKDEAESIKSAISRVGHLEFRIVMRGDGRDDDVQTRVLIADETKRLAELLAATENTGRPVDDLDLSSLEIKTPDALYRWYPFSDKYLAAARGADATTTEVDIEALLTAQPLGTSDFRFIKRDLAAVRTFTGADIVNSQQTMDQSGNPAVSIDMDPSRASEFGDWTEPNVGRAMGLLLDGRLAEQPATINSRLENNFIIQSGGVAGFTSAEIKDYLTVIKSGSLQMKPRLLFENTVGPSLGETAISAGVSASLYGFLAIIIFMIVYYRTNGVIAAICLLVNMTLLAGILMFLGATLTLPGIAGLVLTIGMAVDANILVFERIREEVSRSKGVDQAVRLGFEKAFSTIVDANVTTFVTAFILYKVGTGPVRGFSVILMMGIASSVFSVLVVGRVFYDKLIQSGWTGIGMRQLLKRETHIGFMAKSRVALRISALLVTASLVAFFQADRDKYGLDFLGGYKAQVRLQDTASQSDMSEAVGGRFEGAQVISVVDDLGSSGTSSKQFVIKIKARPGEIDDDNEDGTALEDRFEVPLKTALSDRILPDFVTELTLTEDAEGATTAISGVLNFEAPADPAQAATPEKVAAHLGFLSNLTTSQAPGGAIAVGGNWARIDLDNQQVVQRLRVSLAGSNDLPAPSEPFLESTTIGSRVGTELRDSAIRAILLSFIAIVLYIRIRFREYRYGIAAIVALAHDVSITLGVVALAHFSGLVDVEIDLAMIAAFLTIIGYSLNDTIVLFDRIRENLPRLTNKSYSEVLDISINQTLSRTLLTSMTTLVALIIIFVVNYGRQNVLEGFSFAMILGVLVGTYSSIFVASPVLVMIHKKHGDLPTNSPETKGGSKKKGGKGQPGGVPA